MKNFKLIAYPFVLCFVLLACSAPKALEYKNFHNFSISSVGFDQSTVHLDLEYYNPNNFGMQLRKTDFDIFINNNLLGHSTTDTLVTIPGKSNFVTPVEFKLDMKNIFKNAYNTLIGKEVLIRLTGKVKMGKGNVFINYPVQYETKQTFSFF